MHVPHHDAREHVADHLILRGLEVLADAEAAGERVERVQRPHVVETFRLLLLLEELVGGLHVREEGVVRVLLDGVDDGDAGRLRDVAGEPEMAGETELVADEVWALALLQVIDDLLDFAGHFGAGLVARGLEFEAVGADVRFDEGCIFAIIEKALDHADGVKALKVADAVLHEVHHRLWSELLAQRKREKGKHSKCDCADGWL